jgi:hypothetical protein
MFTSRYYSIIVVWAAVSINYIRSQRFGLELLGW